MTEELSILAILKKVEYTGFTIHPYVYLKNDLPYINPLERITNLNFETYPTLSELAVKLYMLSDEIEPHALVSRFTKKKISIKEFFGEKETLLSEVVQPFIDKKLSEMIELIAQSSVPLFNGIAMPHLYPTDEIKIVPGKAKTVLRFDRNEEGTIYSLEVFNGKSMIQLQDHSNFLLTSDPCLLVNKNRIIIFEKNITGKILSPFLQKEHINIPKRLETKYFSSFIKKLVNNSEIVANGFKIHDVTVEPSAILSIETDWLGKPCIILKFIYGEKSFLSDNPQKNFTELKTDEEGFTFYRSRRNKAWEAGKIDYLKHIGLQQYASCYKLPDIMEGDSFYHLITWFIDNKDTLLKNGFTIDDETQSKYALSFGQLDQDLKTNNDWFDLNIILKIEDQEIPFIKFRRHILERKREYRLPDGKIFLIPLPWFDRYIDVMVLAESNGNDLRLRKHHYPLLNQFSFNQVDDTAVQSSPYPIQLPLLNNVNLRPYQVAGFEWMVQLNEMGFGGILADDMGLGKTLQAIALLSFFYKNEELNETPYVTQLHNPLSVQLNLFEPIVESVKIKTPESKESFPQLIPASLIVMPASLIHNWENELNRFAPFLRKLIYTGSGRKKSLSFFNNYQIILTTYGTLRNDIELLSSYPFSYAILDEGQQIKNPSSQTAQSVFCLRANNKFVLTGTPVENSLTDLWSQMNFTNPGLLGDLATFNTYYAVPLAKDPENHQSVRLLSMISPFILRRTKESVAPELPELTETVNYCEMTDDQHTLYESEKSKIRNQVFEQIEKGNISETPMMVLKALMQLRQIANHPRMINPESDAGSGKFDEITDKLEIIIAEQHRVLIFSSFVKHLNLIEEYCIMRGFIYAKLTGSTTNRGKVVTEFKENDNASIFLISLKAGGVGLNLTEADYVFMLDPWWNPAAEMQAINRAHRIGQDKSVFVYRFITKDSIEEKIMKLQEKKKALADAFIKPQSAISGMSKEEIMHLFD